MDKPSSYSVAPSDPARLGILSKAALLGVVTVALIALALVFPKSDLLTRLRTGIDGEGADNELTIAYLRNLIRTERADVGLRILLIEKLMLAGEYAEAEKILRESKSLLLEQSDGLAKWNALDEKLTWTRYRFLSARLQNLDKEKSSSRQANDVKKMAHDQEDLDRLRAQLEGKLRAQLPHIKSAAQIKPLLAHARDIGSAALVKELIFKLRDLPDTSEAQLREIARDLIAQGDLVRAAETYFLAKNKTEDVKTQQELSWLGVKTLVSANQVRQAYDAAVRELGSLPAGDAQHWQLIDLALASGQAPQALQHLQKLLPQQASIEQLASEFNFEQLSKAIDVALAGSDLALGFKLAQAATIGQPGNAALLERVAQLAEWSGKPQEALTHWLALMRQTTSARATENVMRLAPLLFDDEALLAAMASAQKGRALDFSEVEKVVQIYERLGQPESALSFLDRLSQDSRSIQEQSVPIIRTNSAFEKTPTVAYSPQQWLMVVRSELLERNSRLPQAVALLENLREQMGERGMNRREVMRLARMQVRSANIPAALRALLAFTSQQTDFDHEYWSLRADIAYEVNRHDVYPGALEKIWQASTQELLLEDYQIERLLRSYMEVDRQKDVLRIASALLPRVVSNSGQDMVIGVWLEAIAAEPNRADYRTWRLSLQPAQVKRIEQSPDALSRRASVLASIGDKREAAQDYRASLALRADTATRISYYWLLIDMSEARLLQAELNRGGAALRKDPADLEVQGAAYQLLGQWRRAVSFYSQQTREQSKASDFLWLANYADVLDSAGETSVALRIRRHAFALLSPQLNQLSTLKKRDAVQALIVRLRLAESFASGEEKARLAVLLGRTLKDNELPADLAKQANDLIISWALGSANGSGPAGARTELSRQWLWMQQARKALDRQEALAKGEIIPAIGVVGNSLNYARMSLALVENDLQSLDYLMENAARDFQQLDQLNALRQLGAHNPQRLAQAATQAVELGQRDAETLKSDEQQEVMEADLLRLASRAKTEVISRKQEVLNTQGMRHSAVIAWSPRLRLSLQLDHLNHESNNSGVLAPLAAIAVKDRQLQAGAIYNIPRGEISASLHWRDAWAKTAGFVLKLTQQITAQSSVQALLAIRQRSDDSAALSLTGMQNKISAQFSSRIAKDLDLNAEIAQTRYMTQAGTPLGQSQLVGAQATYFLRREYPDAYAKIGIRRFNSKAQGIPEADMSRLTSDGSLPNADFFIPAPASNVSLSVGVGQSQMLDNSQVYSRALRPWLELGIERRLASQHNGQTLAAQTNRLLRAGVRGSIAGRDQLSAGIEIRPTPAGQTATEFRVQYEWIGDR